MEKKRRKTIAPQDHGEMPLEERCPKCWRLLTDYEISLGVNVKWCMHCQYIKQGK